MYFWLFFLLLCHCVLCLPCFSSWCHLLSFVLSPSSSWSGLSCFGSCFLMFLLDLFPLLFSYHFYTSVSFFLTLVSSYNLNKPLPCGVMPWGAAAESLLSAALSLWRWGTSDVRGRLACGGDAGPLRWRLVTQILSREAQPQSGPFTAPVCTHTHTVVRAFKHTYPLKCQQTPSHACPVCWHTRSSTLLYAHIKMSANTRCLQVNSHKLRHILKLLRGLVKSQCLCDWFWSVDTDCVFVFVTLSLPTHRGRHPQPWLIPENRSLVVGNGLTSLSPSHTNSFTD